MRNHYIFWGSLGAALAVALGAMGAHFIEKNFAQRSVELFETASKYQMFHCFAIIVAGIMAERKKHLSFLLPAILFGTGILFFSGSLYLLAIKDVLSFNTKILGPITPIGGVLFIAGWLLLAIKAIKR
ncbi:MAG: DUF423 domain-containing protein [Bacteroidia bacterium]|nr:DUF423 domain-containing protein [Bacteroidia bacterium]